MSDPIRRRCIRALALCLLAAGCEPGAVPPPSVGAASATGGRIIVSVPERGSSGATAEYSCARGSGPEDARRRARAAENHFSEQVEAIMRRDRRALSDRAGSAERERLFQCERVGVTRPETRPDSQYQFRLSNPMPSRDTVTVTCVFRDSEAATRQRAQRAFALEDARLSRASDWRNYSPERSTAEIRQIREQARSRYDCGFS